MTEPAATPARAFASIDEVFALLRAEGHRVTPAARFVLDALFAAAEEGPISVQQIADRAPTELEPSPSTAASSRASSTPSAARSRTASATAPASATSRSSASARSAPRAAEIDPTLVWSMSAARGR